MNLENKVALITGGAMGIGRGITETFLKYGAEVIILDSNEKLGETLTELNGTYPGKVSGYIVDITKKELLESVYQTLSTKYPSLDIIVNNAGVCKLAPFSEMTDDIRDFHFNINVIGAWNVTKTYLPLLKKSASPAIVNLSSVTGPMVADSGEAAYATSKAAVLGMTKALAMELAVDNIRVNAIMPGYVLTPMVKKMSEESNPENPQSVIDGIAQAIPMKRLADPKEIGELAAFLASSSSSYITGQGIVIDGGSTLPETMTMGV